LSLSWSSSASCMRRASRPARGGAPQWKEAEGRTAVPRALLATSSRRGRGSSEAGQEETSALINSG
jgi:hypothetical protein